MIRDFKDKVAFITGSASGIGSGIAHACAKHGMKVCIVDKREDALQEALKWYQDRGYDATAIPLDVTDREAYVKAADKAEEVYGKINLLVNNAGVSAGRNAWDSTWNDWDFIMSINCMGVVNGVKTMSWASVSSWAWNAETFSSGSIPSSRRAPEAGTMRRCAPSPTSPSPRSAGSGRKL